MICFVLQLNNIYRREHNIRISQDDSMDVIGYKWFFCVKILTECQKRHKR